MTTSRESRLAPAAQACGGSRAIPQLFKQYTGLTPTQYAGRRHRTDQWGSGRDPGGAQILRDFRPRLLTRGARQLLYTASAIGFLYKKRASISAAEMGCQGEVGVAYLAPHGDGRHVVSLDQVIETMRQTGEDMKSKYKETSLGGLAVNVVEC